MLSDVLFLLLLLLLHMLHTDTPRPAKRLTMCTVSKSELGVCTRQRCVLVLELRWHGRTGRKTIVRVWFT